LVVLRSQTLKKGGVCGGVSKTGDVANAEKANFIVSLLFFTSFFGTFFFLTRKERRVERRR